MKTYRTFRPTSFDTAGLAADRHGIGEFLVLPISHTRDSGTIDRSNFRVALRELGGESDTVQVHRFGHWGPGWYEVILIDPSDDKAVAVAEELESSLADYPLLDESDHSELEFEETAEYWQRASVRDRVDAISHANVNAPDEWRISVFAARRDEIPEDPSGRLWERLTADTY